MKKQRNLSTGCITYIKLSVHLREYLKSRYGKEAVSLPVYNPMYGCLEQYLINNYSMANITNRSLSACQFDSIEDGGQKNGCIDKGEFLPLIMPDYVFRKNGMIRTSTCWQLSRQGAVEFNRMAKAEFWRECIRFIDDCFTAARLQGTRMTRENAISDFLTVYGIPMSSYENILRYDQRIRKEILDGIEKRRSWMESLNDIPMTYT